MNFRLSRAYINHALMTSVIFALGNSACSDKKTEEDTPNKPTCGYHSDCGPQEVCFKGSCEISRLCVERTNCDGLDICADETCICPNEEKKCLPVCQTDNDCPSDGHCIDGICEPYPISLDAPGYMGTGKSKLQVGIASVDLDIPVGVSMAGYAMRRGPSTPYRRSLGGSNAWLDRPDVRVIVFDDQEELLILLRVPIPWSTDFMIADTAYKVQQELGINVLENIVSSSPHSHSHPARFWHLVADKYFGVFGYDEFSFEIFDRMTTSLAEAIVLAMNDRQPAKFGYTSIDNFDEDDLIYVDRRPENDGLAGTYPKDDRLFIMRVDDMNDQPRAILAHFGIHGTVFEMDNPVLSGDAGGGIEIEMTRGAGTKYKRPVTGFFIQGNAGDVSPAGTDKKHPAPERVQLIGQRSWDVIEPIFDQIETSADIDVSVVSQRVEITHTKLGYTAPEFYDTSAQCEDSAPYFRYGAFQCVEGYPARDSDPNTRFQDGDLNCIFAIECLTAGYPVPQFQKTRLSVAQLGGLALVTVPGEPLSQYGRELSSRVKDQVTSAKDALVVGYSQDHHFYLLGEEDWWQGGYEASRVIWGWRLGDYLADASVALSGELNKAQSERTIDNGNLKPMYWDIPEEERAPVPLNDSEQEPTAIIVDLPEQVERMQVVDYSWVGGHPGIDRPQIVLETQTMQGFEAYLREDQTIYTDADFEMLVHYDGDCNRKNCTEHAWRVSWEERRNFPTGTYRFRITGQAQRDGKIQAYELISRPFEVVVSSSLLIEEISWDDNKENLIVGVRYPEAVRLEDDGDEKKVVSAGHLLRSRQSRSEYGAPLPSGDMITCDSTLYTDSSTQTASHDVAITQTTGSRKRIVGYDANQEPIYDTKSNQVLSQFKIPQSASSISTSSPRFELTVTDQFGNIGTVTATVSIPM